MNGQDSEILAHKPRMRMFEMRVYNGNPHMKLPKTYVATRSRPENHNMEGSTNYYWSLDPSHLREALWQCPMRKVPGEAGFMDTGSRFESLRRQKNETKYEDPESKKG